MSFERPSCYVASPLGFNEPGRHYYENVYLPTLSIVVDVVDPWSFTTPEEYAAAVAEGREREMDLEIGRRNATAIRSSDLLVALLDGQECDSGTVAEVAYAAGKGKLCFGLRSDLRQSGEGGVAVNLQVEYFILESGGSIVSSLSDLIGVLQKVSADASTA